MTTRQIWIDADACPTVIKEVLLRAAERHALTITLVANRAQRLPAGSRARMLCVATTPDAADNEIVRRLAPGDLVVTADIPLAAAVLEKGGSALNPRGERYDPATIRSRLTLRDFMETLRASGIQSGGPAPLSPRERQQFANQLQRWLQAC
ncbi:hypothetical protein A9798_11120 [Edwardsiella hoshinae]|uniref:UPF0178 protein A9798_11120 n=1 Tax=Edwardsiella hoshinae TaxID=93378 RepID=A0A376DID5_9GAMM|nr:YaiI/YqxD family protein [Edwardsiella hoshinae]AOV97443.1 hypothetical protein A9798_11120 [Edwardsiella hoshinae]QPR26617.1 YaiI/YqxD family protein [Edwardsiella hoshinae]STC89884.1 Uncharacterized BCR, YaiI/YqxD family COG1671 [Edwardsiella hoshinae]